MAAKNSWRRIEVGEDAMRFSSAGGFFSLEEMDEEPGGVVRWDAAKSAAEPGEEKPSAPAKKKKKTQKERKEKRKASTSDEAGGERAAKAPKTKPAAKAAPAAAAAASQAGDSTAAEPAADASDPVDTSAWASFGLHPALMARIATQGFSKPTPIQAACLPPALHGRRDIIGAAETGSGKTLAFGLPIMHRLLEETHDDAGGEGQHLDGGLFALVITPTRELALQVADHFRALLPPTGSARVVTLVGGMAVVKQKRLLATRPPIVVATPGRLWELLSSDAQPHLRNLGSLRFFVLDEVDRMVDAGHFRELDNVLQLLQASADDGKAGEAAEAQGGGGSSGGSGGGGGGGKHFGTVLSAGGDGGAASSSSSSSGKAAGGSGKGGGSGGAAVKRQTFLFSATLMLPPGAKEANAKKILSHKPMGTSTMDNLLKKIVFKNQTKVLIPPLPPTSRRRR